MGDDLSCSPYLSRLSVMPLVSVSRKDLENEIGTMTQEEFEEKCFQFGIELDEVTNERLEKIKSVGHDSVSDDLCTEDIYKLDVSANRYDLLCLEGVTRALSIYYGHMKNPVYKTVKPAKMERMIVEPACAQIRPYVVCAILRNITFDEKGYKSFIDLQEKLHFNICRRRTLVAIGTHDYDKIQGPFTYKALPPKDIKFKPLNQDKEMDAEEMMHFYETDPKGAAIKEYVKIIKDSPVYPVIYDANGKVLSLPPIINGDHSKIELGTKNVFIECTATDLTKARTTLNTVVCMFSQHCKEQYEVEQVEVSGVSTGPPELAGAGALTGLASTESTYITPVLDMRPMPPICCDYIRSLVGSPLDNPSICLLLERMQLEAKEGPGPNQISVLVPPTRSDVFHACDVAEDVAIAYGYNNVEKTIPPTNTIAKPLEINKLSDYVRLELAAQGYMEVLTFGLCSTDESYKMLNRPAGYDGEAVTIANPKTAEFQVARSSLFPGLLKTLRENKDQPRPLQLFEVSDCVVKGNDSEVSNPPGGAVGAINRRRASAMYSGTSSGVSTIHGVMDAMMMKLGAMWETDKKERIVACDKAIAGRKAEMADRQKKLDKVADQLSKDATDLKKLISDSEEAMGKTEDAKAKLEKKAEYKLAHSDDPVFWEGQGVDITIGGKRVGKFGTLHPQVLDNFGITFPCSAMEIDVEHFLPH